MLMTAEDVIRARLDALHPKPVPYIGQPECDAEVPKTQRQLMYEVNVARAEKARRRTEQLARLEFEQKRLLQISAANPDIPTILAAVAAAHGVLLSMLLSKSKADRVARTRHHAVWELKQRKPHLSSVQVATILKRDSSTIRDSLRVFERDRHLHEGKVQAVAHMLAARKAA